jgi:predicted MFS family arabinose efflux permease
MNRDLVLVSLSLMTWGLGEGMFFFFQPLYLQELGADPLKIGGILGLVGLAMGAAYLPAGYLSDHIGRRPMIYASWILGALSTWIMVAAQSLPIFVVGMVLYGMTAFVTVPLNSYVTTARGQWTVGRTLTLISASFSFGSILGPLLGGWLGARLGLHANFRFAAFIFIISTLIILFIRPQPVEVHPAAGRLDGLRALKSERYLQYLVLIFFIVFSLYFPQPLSQNFLQNERGINLVMIGVLISMRSLGVVLLNLVLGQFNARLGLLISQVAMMLFCLLILLGNGLPAYMAGYLLMGSYVTARGLITAQGRSLVESANMGVAYGLIETVNALAIILGPPLAGLIYERAPSLVYVISLGLIGLGLVVNLAWSPIGQQDLIAFEERERIK